MANVAVANTTANMQGKTLLVCENPHTVTGLVTFSRSPSAPFAVAAGSGVVANLDADKVDGFEASELAILAQNETVAGTWTFTNRVTLNDGATLDGHLLFTDATFDIGASGATRPRDFYLSRNAVIGGTLDVTGNAVFFGNVALGSNSSDLIDINGLIDAHVLFTDATYDLGASGATRPRDLFLSRNAVIGGTLNVTGNITSTGTFNGLTFTAFANTETGTQNNWSPSGMPSDGNFTILWSGASALTVTGIASGTTGQILVFKNLGTSVATFSHDATGSSDATNCFRNMATSAGTPVAAGGCAIFQHDGARWALIGHEQGAWITPTFNAGHFTASESMTWTVAEADRQALAYKLNGRTLSVIYALIETTVGGTASTNLKIGNGQWGGFSCAESTYTTGSHLDDLTTPGTTLVIVSSTDITLWRSWATPVWTLCTNRTHVSGQVSFGVT